jgi:uncharacterized protein YdaL
LSANDDGQVLILYDSSGQYGWIGAIHARQLASLLGHFDLRWQILPVEQYHKLDLNHFRATFYFGNVWQNAVPDEFLQDVMTTNRPVCWFKYNLWKIAGNYPVYKGAFEARFGFRFQWMDSNGYPEIRYKGQSFNKYQADPELGRVDILSPSIATVYAVAYSADGLTSIPYIVKGRNLWYVGDLPFSYMREDDRYVAFTDALHDMVGIDHPKSKRAIIRIEDVDPTTPPDSLRRVADYLYSQRVPFAVAVIPVYTDPLGHHNNGVPQYVPMSKNPEFIKALQYMISKGGQIVIHGYTHQYRNIPNPYDGVTGDDFEFLRVTIDQNFAITSSGPVPEDSVQWVQDRIDGAIKEVTKSGLNYVAWETPHYGASALDYLMFARRFRLTIQRVLDYDYAVPIRLGALKKDHSRHYFAGQFYPYVIENDIYGQKIAPENLGDITPVTWNGLGIRLPADLVRDAQRNLAVRDGWASAFFHPFLDIQYLQQLVQGIKALGYTYVPLSADMR